MASGGELLFLFEALQLFELALYGLPRCLEDIHEELCFHYNSKVCHPRCVFKLYGEVNSVKKQNYKIWLNDGVY